MRIKLKVKNVFGTPRLYPACGKAKTLCKLLNQRVLSKNNIRHIKALGFAIDINPDHVDACRLTAQIKEL